MSKSYRLGMLKKQNGKKQPLYKQISEQLKLCIESGSIKPGACLPSVSELVRQYSVEYKTVMLALEVLEKEGLIKPVPGRGKGAIVLDRPTRKFSIMFIRWDRDSMSLEMTEGVRRFTDENNFECIVFDASRSHGHVIDAIRHPMWNVDGLLVFPQDRPEYINAVNSAIESGIKIVFLDRVLDGVQVSSVSVDHVNGAYKATKHLLNEHHMPVYYIGSTKDPSSVRDRLHGWSTAMRQYNFTDVEKYIYGLSKPEHELALNPEIGVQCNYETAKRLFTKEKKEKYCIFTVNDLVAQGVYQVAQELGYVIGENVFIASFGDMPLCERLPVPLTSICQCDGQVGYEACKTLYMELAGMVHRPVHRVLPAELHIRRSSVSKEQWKQMKTVVGSKRDILQVV